MSLTESGQFPSVIADTSRATGYSEEMVLDDYWLIRGLYGVARNLDADGLIRRGPTSTDIRRAIRQDATLPKPVVGRWGFAGGTSLTAAWQLVERFSSDLYYCLYLGDTPVSPKALTKAHQRVATWVTDEVEGTRSSVGRNIRVSQISTVDGRRFKLDGVTQQTDPHGSPTKRLTVRSIVARYRPDLQQQHQELGGFSLPVVVVPVTTVNKLDALHRRAVVGRLVELTLRVRDVYDLAAIANSEHADETRERIPELAARMVVPRRQHEPRPEEGYGSTELYRRGSPAYEALRTAYSGQLPAVLPAGAELPDFGDSMKAIRDLDSS